MRDSRSRNAEPSDATEPADVADTDTSESTIDSPQRARDDAIHEFLEDLEFEQMMEEPTEGPLSIISDEDVPGEPG